MIALPKILCHLIAEISPRWVLAAGLLCLPMVGVAIGLGRRVAHFPLGRFALLRIRDRQNWASMEVHCQQTEEQLRRSEQWLHHYSQLSPGNIYTLVEEPDGRVWFEYISSAVEVIHEFPPEQVLQDASLILNSIHPDDRVGYQEKISESRQSLHPFSHQWRIVTPSGQVKWLEGNAQPERRDHGATVWHGVVVDITARKVAELALQQSETLNRAIFHALPDLIIRMHRDGTYLDIKSSTAFPTRFPKSGIGDNIRNNLPPDIAEQRLAATAKALQTGNIQVYEFPLWVEGQHLWQEARIIPLTADEVLIVIRDLTQRHQMELALQESETHFRQLAETVEAGFFVYEVASDHYSYINPAYKSIIGTPAPKGIEYWLKHIHPEDRDRIKARLAHEQQGECFDEEYRFIQADGQIRWLRSKAFPIPNAAGTIVRVVGIIEDVTDRKWAEAALRESEERFRRAFDNAPIGVSLVSPSGQFLKVNASYCSMLGYTEAELMALTFQEITHPADLEADLQGFRSILAGELRSFQMEKRYINKQGAPVPVLMSTAPVRDHQGQLLYLVGHIQDIRDRLNVERMKDEFISVVSHELRTPLTSIQGALGILNSGVFNDRPEKAHHMLQIAINNSDRLVRLVNDILTLERLESGKVQLVTEPCQVTDLMQQAVDSVQAIADQSGIQISLTPLSSILWASPDAIIQTLTNLLSNAIKFSSPGDTVWLNAEIQNRAWPRKEVAPSPPAPSPCLLFTVKDQGRGIPADKLDRIFEQFQQVDVSDSRKKGGTGLGLTICRNIVQQHGGQIWAESTPGKGSTFYVALPLTVRGNND
jgi:PAS domain S-box-containing protein